MPASTTAYRCTAGSSRVQRQRHPEVVVEIALGREHAGRAAEQHRNEILGRGLARAARDADDRPGERPAMLARNRLEGRQRIRHHQLGQREPGPARLTSAPAAPAAAAAPRNSWPSRRPDFSATKSWPGLSSAGVVGEAEDGRGGRHGPAAAGTRAPAWSGGNAVMPGLLRRSCAP